MPDDASRAPAPLAASVATGRPGSTSLAQAARATTVLRLGGLTCAACSSTIEAALAAVPGVDAVRVNGATHLARIEHAPERAGQAELVDAVRRAGYDAATDEPESARALRQRERRSTLWRLFVAAFCAMQVMMLATPSYVADAGTLEPDMRQLLNWGSWVLTLPVLGFAGMPYLQAAWRSLRRRSLGMEVPVSLGLLVTFVASTIATFEPGAMLGHEVYFDSLTMFLAFLWLGRWLEMGVRHRAAEQLEASMQALPVVALRLSAEGEPAEVPLIELSPGDRLQIRPGDTLPVDGMLLDANAEVSEALLTGEPAVVRRQAGDTLLAGSLNEGPAFRMQALRVGDATRLHGIVALMRAALTERPDAARLADRWAAPFLAVVLILALGAGFAWSTVDPARAVWVVVSVLIVTCPCALSLATPTTLVAAAGGLARRGLLLRRLGALERLAQADVIVFDKTGTLTEDRPRARLLHAEDAAGDLSRAISLAGLSSHPLARAVASLEQPASGGATASVHDWHEVSETPGLGVQARDAQGRSWRLGSAAWVGVAQGAAQARVWLACEGLPRAWFAMLESIRPDARATVDALQEAGLEAWMLTGDASERAHEVARACAIARVQAGVSPEGKLAVVQGARGRGHVVAAVGDGVNDAPLLAAADVSFALGHGALAAREGADAVIVGGRLASVADARLSAQRTLAIVRQNMVWAATYNALCIPLALAGWLAPWAAGLGMAASSLFVILNAQRAARPPATHQVRAAVAPLSLAGT
jgi:Cu2+-exporting ATPase